MYHPHWNRQHESNNKVAMLPFIIASLILPTLPRCRWRGFLLIQRPRANLLRFSQRMWRIMLMEDKSLWHGERNVRQRTETWGIYEVHKKKPTRRLFYMLWMPLLKVLPNYLYILLTLMFLFWLSDGIQICAPTLALLLGPAVVVELSTWSQSQTPLGPLRRLRCQHFMRWPEQMLLGVSLEREKPLVGMSLITPALLSCKLLLTSVVGNSQMTAQEVEWNSWFVGCTNQRQTSKLSKPSDGPSLRKIKLSLRGCRPHKLLSIKPYWERTTSFLFGTTIM